MTGLGEEVYTDRSAALDALTAESQRLGLYDTPPRLGFRLWANGTDREHPR